MNCIQNAKIHTCYKKAEALIPQQKIVQENKQTASLVVSIHPAKIFKNPLTHDLKILNFLLLNLDYPKRVGHNIFFCR